MRRLVVSVIVAFGLVMTGAGPVLAEPAPGATTAKAAAGKKICKVTDPKLDELSGIVATQDGFVVVNDSTSAAERIYFLDQDCEITDEVSYSGAGPRDPEDLVLSADGETLWIADTGDNTNSRETIALWSMPADGSKRPKIHRLSYPDGPHDAEAMLLDGSGNPIIVTKEVGKPAGVYTTTAQLETDNSEGVPLTKTGEITVPASDTTGNTFARLGRGTINGGAIASGGGKVVLRTYTDALEWAVSNGDVLAALKGKPRVTPLPDEPLGEAITYSPDGKYFYTVSDMQGKPEAADNNILRYTPVAKTAPAKAASDADKDSGPSWLSNLTINDITYLVGAVGVLGAILVGLGIFGIVRARKRPPADPTVKGEDGPTDPKPTDAETELLTVGGAAAAPGRGSGVYGGGARASGPGVYGAKPASAYGGGRQPPQVPPPDRPGPRGQSGGRPGQGGHPGARPGQGQPSGRPGQGQPGGPPGQGQPGGRSGQGQPGGPPGQGQPGGSPGQGQPGGRPGQGQPGGRSGVGGQSGGRPRQPGGRPTGRGSGSAGGSGVYGAPPPPPATGNAGGHPAPAGGMNDYADLDGHGQGHDVGNQGYGRR